MTTTYIFQMKLKTKLKKASFNWESKSTSSKDMGKTTTFLSHGKHSFHKCNDLF